jgi:hypothetical protein
MTEARRAAGRRAGRAVAAAVILICGAAACARDAAERTALEQLYTPHYAPPPASESAVVSLAKLEVRLKADATKAA